MVMRADYCSLHDVYRIPDTSNMKWNCNTKKGQTWSGTIRWICDDCLREAKEKYANRKRK